MPLSGFDCLTISNNNENAMKISVAESFIGSSQKSVASVLSDIRASTGITFWRCSVEFSYRKTKERPFLFGLRRIWISVAESLAAEKSSK